MFVAYVVFIQNTECHHLLSFHNINIYICYLNVERGIKNLDQLKFFPKTVLGFIIISKALELIITFHRILAKGTHKPILVLALN